MVQFKSVNAVESFHRDSLLLTTESLGVPGTLLINLTMKTPTGFKSGDTGLVIGNCLIDSLHFHYNKAMYKYLKYKLNMKNKAYLHPIRTSHYSKNVSSCHVLTSHSSSKKISPYLKLKLPLIFLSPTS